MSRKFGLFGALRKTFGLIWRMLDHWYVPFIYAGILTFISLIFRRWSYSCQTADLPAWCVTYPSTMGGIVSYLSVYYIGICAVIFAFGYDIYNVSFKREPFKLKNIISFNKQKIKAMGMLFCSIIALVFPVILAAYLINRPAVPVFEIELIFFTIVFLCALSCVLFIRLSSYIAYYMNDYKMPSLMDIFRHTSGRTYVALVLFLTSMLIMCICQIRLMGALTNLNEHDLFSTTVLSEYIDYVVKLFFFGLYLAVFRAQYELLKEDAGELTEPDIVKEPAVIANDEAQTADKDATEPKKAKRKKAASKKAASSKTSTKKKSLPKKTKK